MPKTAFAAMALVVASSAPALAWNDMPLGEFAPATDEVAVWAYPADANYCPSGLQPVVVGGVVCCGVPNRTGYAWPAVRSGTPRGSYIATGKGLGEGYYSKE